MNRCTGTQIYREMDFDSVSPQWYCRRSR
jgi:hypothetical protein